MDKLESKQQMMGLFLSIVTSLEIVFSVYFLFRISTSISNASIDKISIPTLLIITCLGGFLGGSTRALNKLVLELNDIPERVSARLSRWFLYLFKPFIGVGGGLTLFVFTNLGLLTGMSFENVEFNFYSVILISFIGGMFFEDVFKKLQGTIEAPKDKAAR